MSRRFVEDFRRFTEAAYSGKREFITNKRAVGRLQDRADLEALGEK